MRHQCLLAFVCVVVVGGCVEREVANELCLRDEFKGNWLSLYINNELPGMLSVGRPMLTAIHIEIVITYKHFVSGDDVELISMHCKTLSDGLLSHGTILWTKLVMHP